MRDEISNESVQGRRLSVSLMESWALELLEEQRVPHKSEWTHSQCRGKKNRPLRFDVAIGVTNHGGNPKLLLEFHGEQHYLVTYFGNESEADAKHEFEAQKYRDARKQTFCWREGIPLEIVPYTVRNEGEDAFRDALSRILREHSIIKFEASVKTSALHRSNKGSQASSEHVPSKSGSRVGPVPSSTKYDNCSPEIRALLERNNARDRARSRKRKTRGRPHELPRPQLWAPSTRNPRLEAVICILVIAVFLFLVACTIKWIFGHKVVQNHANEAEQRGQASLIVPHFGSQSRDLNTSNSRLSSLSP